MKFSSGYVISGAYADKVRRTLFAQLKDKLDEREIAKGAAILNKLLYEIFVNRLKIDKGDLIRVRIDYDIEDGEIKWNYDTLEIEVFKRIPQDEVEPVVRETVSRIEDQFKDVEYDVEVVGESVLGEMLYTVKAEDKEAGIVAVSTLGSSAVIRGAVIYPVPTIIDNVKVDREQATSNLSEVIKDAVKIGKVVDLGKAVKVVESLKALLASEE